MASDVRSMLSECTIEVGPENKDFHISLLDFLEKQGKPFHYEIKAMELVHNFCKTQDDYPETDQEAIHQGQLTLLLDIKSAYCHIPIVRRHHCFLSFRWRGKVYQFRTLASSLSTASKTFTRVMKPILLQCQKMGIIVFLYLDDTLVLANSYTQAKEDGWRVVQFIQRLGFVLSLDLSVLFQETFKTPAELFKGLKPNTVAIQALNW